MPVRLVQSLEDRQDRFALAPQKLSQHLVVGFAFDLSHIHSSQLGELVASIVAASSGPSL
jgi:hypothetical protein